MNDQERAYWLEYKEMSQAQLDNARRVLGEYATTVHVNELREELHRVSLEFYRGEPTPPKLEQEIRYDAGL